MRGKPVAKDVDQYLQWQRPEIAAMLAKLRATIRAAAPTAEESISYGMPAYKLNGPLVYFGAFAKHCSLFPGNAKLIAQLEKELAGFTTAKGTIQFTVDNPLPAKLVRKIVLLRVKENLAK